MPAGAASLQELVDWRNAIAHQDFDPVGGDPKLHLSTVRAWRTAANSLADDFDRAMRNYLPCCSAARRGNINIGELIMPEARFHKGDRVRFRLGIRSVLGVVREDRGAIWGSRGAGCTGWNSVKSLRLLHRSSCPPINCSPCAVASRRNDSRRAAAPKQRRATNSRCRADRHECVIEVVL